jgi:hypothetical protein
MTTKFGVQLGLLLMGLAGFSAIACAQDCIDAVDATDTMNLNATICSDKKSGINGAIHRALNSPEKPLSDEPLQKTATKLMARHHSYSVALENWSGLTVAKATLFQRALMDCEKGFSIAQERYMPLAMGRIEFTLDVNCES